MLLLNNQFKQINMLTQHQISELIQCGIDLIILTLIGVILSKVKKISKASKIDSSNQAILDQANKDRLDLKKQVENYKFKLEEANRLNKETEAALRQEVKEANAKVEDIESFLKEKLNAKKTS